MEQVTQRRPRRRSLTPYQIHRRLQGRLLAALLLGTVLLFLLVGFLQKDREFSDSENRKLAQAPGLAQLKDGTYLKGLGDYVADQFPFRDKWISLSLKVNTLLGQKEANGVYLCGDDYLMQIPAEPNREQVTRNLQAVEAFAAAYPEVSMYMTVVPNAVTVHADKLPENAPVRDQLGDLQTIASQLNTVQFLDVTQALMDHRDEYLFYKTDHHWTSLAAFYAYQSMASSMGILVPDQNAYTVYPVSNPFEGTLSSKSGSHKALDTVEIYVPTTDIEYYVNYPDTGENIRSLYRREALEQKDHYTVFFGGNHPRLDVTTTADTGRSLLIFKDSYANCMVQFLYPNFDHITIIDPRYFYDNIDLVMKSESITDVLYLYNLDTFNGDTSLADVLARE